MAIHVVVRGDTLWSISQRYNVTIPVIREVNGLAANNLMPGLALYIPDERLPERYYPIQAGDNLWRISQRFTTSIQAILQANPGIIAENLFVGQILTIPTQIKYPMQTLAFIDAFIPTPISDKLSKISATLTYLAVFTYSVTSEGTLVDINDDSLLQEIKQHNVKPLMVLSNFVGGSFDPELAAQVLAPNVRRVLITNVVNKVQSKGYSGVSIDFESIPPNNRSDFTSFLRELKAALGSMILHVSVFSKTADIPSNPFAGAFDYGAIGEIADIVTVLTYDYGYAVGPPDPNAPIWWINEVLRYATSLIPKSKLMLAIALYGYDWVLPDTPEVNAKAIPVNIAQNQALRYNSVIQYNSIAEAPYYRYWVNSVQHIVWFEDPRSLVAKYKVLESYGLLGASYWRFRYDFPQNWAYLEENIAIIK